MNIAVNHSAPLSVKNMMKATLFLNHKIGAEWRFLFFFFSLALLSQ
jgi:hypothetical protein